MGLFGNRQKKADEEKGLKKVEDMYQKAMIEFGVGQELYQEFKERYFSNLATRKVDMLFFLYHEYQTASALYNRLVAKKQEAQEKKERLEAYTQRDFTGKILAQHRQKIEKYPQAIFTQDDELNRLLGAMQDYSQTHWPHIDHLISLIYKTSSNNPLFSLSVELDEFITKQNSTTPHVLFYYKQAEKSNMEKQLEQEKNKILKRAGLLLNKIKRQLEKSKEFPLIYNSLQATQIEELLTTTQNILSDFRISHFTG